jgi:hypothetical protein
MQTKNLLCLFVILSAAVSASAQNFIDKYLTDPLTYTTIGSAAQSINQPRDLDFKPNTNELWVVNRATSSGGTNVLFYNAGLPNQTWQYRKDSHTSHFMLYPTAMAFSDNGCWGSTAEIQSTGGPTSTFMGPSLWSSDTNIFARVFQNNWVNGLPLGSHLDMLHQSPFAMGIAHDTLNVYWVFDGHNGTLCKYDFGNDHGPGFEDHSDGKIWRYTDITLTRETNVPSHMVKDKSTGWLYIVETFTKKLWRVNTTTGAVSGTLNPPSSGSEVLSGYWAVTGTVKQQVATYATRPSGVDLYNGRMIVSDYDNGNIYVYDITVDPPVQLGTIATGQAGIQGVKIGPDGKIWFVNNTQNTVVRINPTLAVTDAAIIAITSPVAINYETDFYSTSFTTCAASVTPEATLSNNGSATLTSVTVNCYLNGVYVNSTNWTGTLASGATTTVTLPLINVSSGNHKISVRCTNPNSTADNNPANDRKDASFRILNPVGNLPFTEAFAVAGFPAAGWSYVGYNPVNKMSRVAGVGAGCIKMDNYSGAENISGQADYLMLPRINLSTSLPTTFEFDVAYAQYSSSTNDNLRVLISVNCCQTWTTVYNKSGAVLSTAPITTGAFTPTSNQWRHETISLAAYASYSDVMIMFQTISAFGNNIYIDNVNIPNIPTAIIENGIRSFSVYPNPGNGNFTIALSASLKESIEISVWNMLGEQLYVEEVSSASSAAINLNLSDFSNGTYLLRIKAEDEITVRKIIIAK